jgi:sulfoxide reductase catalytic subunit YedY
MLIRKSPSLEATIRSSEITPQSVFEQPHPTRRRFLTSAATLGAAALAARTIPSLISPPTTVEAAEQLKTIPSKYTLDDPQTPLSKASTYNNFYEFGTDKSDPSHEAHRLPTRPWPIQITGMVKKAQTINIDDLIHYRPLESRVYRFRCVEAWSMVIPWDGSPLADFLKAHQPTSRAKYVSFESVVQPQMPGIGGYSGIPFPYKEGLRIDEAMHPLALLATGLYGEAMPNQDGAPIRLIVPWKYGFKCGKSLTRIKLQETQPQTTWGQYGGGFEYGFYANVNPEVDHPRWTQASERRIGQFRRQKTLMFNGYAEQVASMYAGMDLRKSF